MKTLDCRGLACPQPVMRTRDALEQGRPQELLVLVDNAAASENVSRFLRRSAYQSRVLGERCAVFAMGICHLSLPARGTSCCLKSEYHAKVSELFPNCLNF